MLRSEEGGWDVSESACHVAGEAQEPKPFSPCSINRYLLDTCCARGTVVGLERMARTEQTKVPVPLVFFLQGETDTNQTSIVSGGSRGARSEGKSTAGRDGLAIVRGARSLRRQRPPSV